MFHFCYLLLVSNDQILSFLHRFSFCHFLVVRSNHILSFLHRFCFCHILVVRNNHTLSSQHRYAVIQFWLVGCYPLFGELMLGHVVCCTFARAAWMVLEHLFSLRDSVKGSCVSVMQIRTKKKGKLIVEEYFLKVHDMLINIMLMSK